MLAEKRPSTIIAKGRNQVSYFHRSPQATFFYEEKQKVMLPKENHHKLKQDVVTRWNSTLDMLESICEQMPVIHSLMNDVDSGKIKMKDLKKNLLTYNDHIMAQKLIAILQPFKKASELLSGDKNPTLPVVLPVIKILRKALADEDGETNDFREIKQRMLADLEKRFLEYAQWYEMAAIFDPSTKAWICAEKGEDWVKAQLMNELLKLKKKPEVRMKKEETENNDESNSVDEPSLPSLNSENGPPLPTLDFATTDDDENPIGALRLHEIGLQIKKENDDNNDSEGDDACPPAKKMKEEELGWLGDILFVKMEENVEDPVAKWKEEIEYFLRESVDVKEAMKTGFALSWWSTRCRYYPNIARIAKKFLAIPASSVPSERIWSLAGNIVTKKRASINPENVDMLIFLHYNSK